ncbi:hypothetical protein QM797_11960 [Rhodococcus sp. IEGM 1381]|uniref:hypothetical protein n=1 Tax=Rhodococcus sp. IEGM 1381 TaxID=3047085 RepID=UPI0024B6CF98|nr:hypothetical protein [Rhodococcus sp. IEGM 1381]MDI9895441.1 hypothetical protein [Rhodococcus sp. IEGM 1381]
MSALPRRGGALPGDPTVPMHAARTAPTISMHVPHVDTPTKNSAVGAAPANAAAANRPGIRTGHGSAIPAVPSGNQNPSSALLLQVAVAVGPRLT